VKQEKIGIFVCDWGERPAHGYRSGELWQRLQRVCARLFIDPNLYRYNKETQETVAIKVIDLDYAEDDVDDIMKEIAILAQLNSKYVTRCHNVCEIITDRRYFGSYVKGSQLWIVMEYCGGASCADLVSLVSFCPKLIVDET